MSDDDTLHRRERELQEDIPNTCHDGEDVLPERQIGGGDLPIVCSDGKFLGPFERGRRKLNKGREGLLGYLLPITIWTNRRGQVKVSRDARFYFEDEEVHIRVQQATIDGNGQIFLTFRETTMDYPRRSWTFRTVDLARYIEEERLRHDREDNERAENMLDNLRGESEA